MREGLHIEAAAAERPYRGKGNDRLMVVEAANRFALFDGVTLSLAADVAAETFKKEHAIPDVIPHLRDVFEAIQRAIVQRRSQPDVIQWHERTGFEIHLIRTGGVAVGLRTVNKNPVCEYIGVGEPPLFMLQHKPERFTKLVAEDCLFDNFLGAPGLSDVDYVPSNYGGFVLNSAASFALVSGGITGNGVPGEEIVTEEILHDILKNGSSAQHKADQILNAASVEEDASVIVVEVRI